MTAQSPGDEDFSTIGDPPAVSQVADIEDNTLARKQSSKKYHRDLIRKQDRDDRRLQYLLRREFARTIRTATVLVIVASLFAMGAYLTICVMCNDEVVSPLVLVAFFSGTVVQVIGLMAIVAVSLFPPKRNRTDKS